MNMTFRVGSPPRPVFGAGVAAVLITGLLAACGSSGGAGGSAGGFCADQAKVQQEYRAILDSGKPPSIDDYSAIATELQSLKDEAPAAVQADLTTMVSGARKAKLSGSGFLDDPAVAKAASDLNSYIGANC